MKIVHGAVVVSLVAGCASGGAAPPSGPGPAQGAHVGHGHGHGPGHGHGHHGQGMQHRFDGAEGWAKVFDSEDRDAWQKPDEVLSAMGLDKGGKGTELVADVGAGTGYFSVKIATGLQSTLSFSALNLLQARDNRVIDTYSSVGVLQSEVRTKEPSQSTYYVRAAVNF